MATIKTPWIYLLIYTKIDDINLAKYSIRKLYKLNDVLLVRMINRQINKQNSADIEKNTSRFR